MREGEGGRKRQKKGEKEGEREGEGERKGKEGHLFSSFRTRRTCAGSTPGPQQVCDDAARTRRASHAHCAPHGPDIPGTFWPCGGRSNEGTHGGRST